MTENATNKSGPIHENSTPNDNTVTLRVPKPNMQVAILGLVAFITLFQTIQLMRISAKAAAAPVKSAPVSAPAVGGNGSDADVPQSMVGGC